MPRAEEGSSARAARPPELGSGDHFATMAQLMAVSGQDLIGVLEEAGFARSDALDAAPSGTAVRMARAGVDVAFDANGIVPPEKLTEILTTARISIGRLLDSVDSAGRRAERRKRDKREKRET